MKQYATSSKSWTWDQVCWLCADNTFPSCWRCSLKAFRKSLHSRFIARIIECAIKVNLAATYQWNHPAASNFKRWWHIFSTFCTSVWRRNELGKVPNVFPGHIWQLLSGNLEVGPATLTYFLYDLRLLLIKIFYIMSAASLLPFGTENGTYLGF